MPGVTEICASGSAGQVVTEFYIPYPGLFQFCVEPTGFPGRVTVTDGCSMPLGIVNECPSATCLDLFIDPARLLEPYRLFVIWTNDIPDLCGEVFFYMSELSMPPPPIEEIDGLCVDGFDNDANGLTDCEDPKCRIPDGLCNIGIDVELCDGVDNGNTPGFMDNFIDELGCSCVDNLGCDDMRYGSMMMPYLCHQSYGACAPDCNVVPWCDEFGLTCGSNGECM